MGSKLNVLVCTSIFPNSEEPSRGIYIFNQVRALQKHCRIEVIAPVPFIPKWLPLPGYRMYSRVPQRETIDSLDVLHPRPVVIPKLGRLLNGWAYHRAFARGFETIREHFKPDVLLAYWAYPDGFAATLLAIDLKIPAVLGARGCDVNNLPPSGVQRQMTLKALERADRLMAVSTAMKEKIASFGITPDKITVIPNGLDASFVPDNTNDGHRQNGPGQENGEERTILFCGRLSPEKGIDVLLDAVKKLNDRGTPFALLLVGDGPLRKPLEDLSARLGLQEKVRFAGEVPPQRVPSLMNSSHVLCLPSLREGWPNVVMEALGCGIPVVASRVGGVPEILNRPGSGYMVPPGDPTALAEALGRALHETWDRETVREAVAGRTWDHVAEEILHQLRTAMNP